MGQTKLSWVLRSRPAGKISPGDLVLTEQRIPVLESGQVLTRNLLLSLDPANRMWMDDVKQYIPPVAIGEVMRGGVIGVVEESASEVYRPGDLVNLGLAGWETHSLISAEMLSPVPQIPGIPLHAYMTVLGGPGLTAYFGITDIAKPNPGETVVVTSAAGAVGSIAGQIARLAGARVVGIAGGAEKCDWLKEDLRFADAVDYKAEDLAAALDRSCPHGVDVLFENVGGPLMERVVERMNDYGRVALCGLISAYNDGGQGSGISNFNAVLLRRLTIKGFIAIDYVPRMAEAFGQLTQWISSGELKWKVHLVDGLENAVDAFERLFTGDHFGKLVVEISQEP
jgi:hypothetical protein